MGPGKKPYPKEFRSEAVRLVKESGKSQSRIAKDLSVALESLRSWVKQADLDSGKRSDGLTSEEREELLRLGHEVRTLRMEREILKKPRPSSPRRPSRSCCSTSVRDGTEGQLSRACALPSAGDLHQRVLRFLRSATLPKAGRRRPLHGADSPFSPAQPPRLRQTAAIARFQR